MQCCEPSSEERSAGKPHATFCGNRRWATASGDPVLGVKFPGPTRQNSPLMACHLNRTSELYGLRSRGTAAECKAAVPQNRVQVRKRPTGRIRFCRKGSPNREAFVREPQNVCLSRKKGRRPRAPYHCHGHRRPRLYREVILARTGQWTRGAPLLGAHCWRSLICRCDTAVTLFLLR